MKLLIVEDEVKINTALAQGFKEEGFFVDSAFDGEQALKLIDEKEYDCIVLDLMLPKVNGLTVLRTLRKDKNHTPIIILTAKDAIEDKVAGLDDGADDYLAKPFSFDELLSRVKAIIRRYSQHDNVLQVDSLVLDPFKKQVRRAGQEIELSGKDFLLLEYLMRHKGGIVSEGQIMNYIWDYNEEIYSNVVASHIKNIRMKIDKAFPQEKPLIHTLRGFGYKLNG